MTSIDLQKEFSRSKKEGTGGPTSPRNNIYADDRGDYNNQSEFLDSEARHDLKLILDNSQA